MGKQSKKRVGAAPGKRGESPHEARRTGAAKERPPEILLKKDLALAGSPKRQRELVTVAYAPEAGGLQARLLGVRLGDISAIVEEHLLAPARLRIVRTDRQLHLTLQAVAQSSEAYRHADQQRQASILIAMGVKPVRNPERVELAILHALFELPDPAVVGDREFRNARNRLYTYYAALDGLKSLGVAADSVVAEIERRPGRIAACAEVSYASRRDERDRKREEQEPPSHRALPDCGPPAADDEEDAEHQADAKAEGANGLIDEGHARAVGREGDRAGPALLQLTVPPLHGAEFDGDRRVLCVLAIRGDKAAVRAAVQLASTSGATIRRQVEQVVDQLEAAIAKQLQAARRRRKAAATKPKAKRRGGRRGRR